MIDTRAKFEEALAAFAMPGNRWSGLTPLTYWGVACGMDVESVINAAHGRGVTSRDTDIRRGMISARRKISLRSGGNGDWRSSCITQEPILKQVPNMVRIQMETGSDLCTIEALRKLSPVMICHDSDALARRVQSEMHLLSLFSCNDIVQIRSTKDDRSSMLRTVKDWMGTKYRLGEIVRPNPFTGRQGETTDGRPSRIAKSCIADFRHMVFEFDEMTITDQCRFWAGVIRNGILPLVSLTYSGGKSLHGVVRVSAANADAYEKHMMSVVKRYACDPDPRYCLDVQALYPLTGCRLAGIVRQDTGRVQELLYVRHDWYDTDWQHELNK